MKTNELDYPKEWVELVKEAMKSGIKKEDFKKFLIKEKDKRQNKGLTY
ncbi:anti-repressor SinI family protein [Bacillus sp. ISL-18]|nr:anti-repressor SinI family protein [Bacillus sp. ISL-18]MBT2659097.1 anti-repressor SinI family protein [Bacillus sp. ISL-18]